MSRTRLGFTSLVATCCLALATFGVAQQDNSQQNNSTSQQQSAMSGQSGMSGQIAPASKKFLDHMAKDSQGEVQVAQMVESKTSNPQVKQYAQKLVQDHQQLDQQMQSTMSQLGMTMPQPMTAQQQQLQSRLQSLSGAQFDKAFVNAAVKDHEKDVREVQQHLQSASNQNVKQLLQGALPVLQQHLQMARQLQSQLGQQGSSRQ